MKEKEQKSSKETSWGGVAGWYDGVVEGEGSYQKEVILPNLLRLVGPHKGQRLLDLACGQGFFSRAFSACGSSVIGVDAGAELIDIAKKNSGDVEYKVSSADQMPFLKDSEFDAVTIILAIQNIAPYVAVLSECSRVLKGMGAGKLFLVLNHPAFRIPAASSWGFDEKADVQYRRIDQYLGESAVDIDMQPGSGEAYGLSEKPQMTKKTISFHRPLQAYFKALQKSGFAVTRLEEWTSHKKSQKGQRQVAEDRARKEIPLFMMIEAVKL